MAGAAVWIGGYLSGLPSNEIKIYLTSLAVALFCGSGNAFNDFMDVESDRISHPARPLPSGRLKLYSAVLTTITLSLFSLIAAAFVSPVIFVITALLHLLLFLYCVILKKIILVGNLTVALAGAMPFIIGGLVAGSEALAVLPGVRIAALFAFVFHFGRELVKDMADLEGDQKAGLKTLPGVISSDNFMWLVSTIMALLIGLTLIPLFFDWYRLFYGVVVVFLVDIPLIFLIVYLWLSGAGNRFKIAGSIFKLLMLFGLIAFVGGNI